MRNDWQINDSETHRGIFESLFPVKITANTPGVDELLGWHIYDWTEQSFNHLTGAFLDADSPRAGTYSVNGISPAVEINNCDLTPPFYAWMRFRCVANGQLLYEFSYPASSASGGTVTNNNTYTTIVQNVTEQFEFTSDVTLTTNIAFAFYFTADNSGDYTNTPSHGLGAGVTINFSLTINGRPSNLRIVTSSSTAGTVSITSGVQVPQNTSLTLTTNTGTTGAGAISTVGTNLFTSSATLPSPPVQLDFTATTATDGVATADQSLGLATGTQFSISTNLNGIPTTYSLTVTGTNTATYSIATGSQQTPGSTRSLHTSSTTGGTISTTQPGVLPPVAIGGSTPPVATTQPVQNSNDHISFSLSSPSPIASNSTGPFSIASVANEGGGHTDIYNFTFGSNTPTLTVVSSKPVPNPQPAQRQINISAPGAAGGGLLAGLSLVATSADCLSGDATIISNGPLPGGLTGDGQAVYSTGGVLGSPPAMNIQSSLGGGLIACVQGSSTNPSLTAMGANATQAFGPQSQAIFGPGSRLAIDPGATVTGLGGSSSVQWKSYSIPYTLFSGSGSSTISGVVIGSIPAKTLIEIGYLDVDTAFTGSGVMGAVISVEIHSATGSKALVVNDGVDSVTPGPSFGQSNFIPITPGTPVLSPEDTASSLRLELDISGGAVGTDLTQGAATMYLRLEQLP